MRLILLCYKQKVYQQKVAAQIWKTKMGKIGRITRIAMEIVQEDGIINNVKYWTEVEDSSLAENKRTLTTSGRVVSMEAAAEPLLNLEK